jgi:Tol biopolymer transport system component
MAPAAQLYLICVDTEVDLKLAEQYARTEHIDVINHSVGWFNTSRGDGTGGAGTPDATVADARANGILWVNSAGNEAQTHWAGSFTPDASAPDLNDFAPGDVGNQVFIAQDEQVCGTLKWDAWPKTSQDYDLYLFDVSTGVPVKGSADDQSTGPSPPLETLCWKNDGSSGWFAFVIKRFSATTAPRMDFFYLGSSNLGYDTPAGSLAEPATSPSALAVGATCWQANGLESYSSLGPTIDGRIKPDLVAPDSVSSAVYGLFSSCGSVFGGFSGTSASAPHVAGAAALVREWNGLLTPAQITATLKAGATDLGPAQPDNSFGAGELRLRPTTPLSRIAFARFTGGNLGIYVMNADGSDPTKIVVAPVGSDDSEPALSPDGGKIAFTRHAGGHAFYIYIVDADRTHLTQLTDGTLGDTDRFPSFSPDGQRIVFVRDGEITTMNVNGTNQTQLTTGMPAKAVPSFSPDGAKIIFSSSNGPLSGIDVMNADGTGETLLLSSGGGVTYGSPVFSPDGSTIAYVRTAPYPSLYLMNSDGTGIRALPTGPPRTDQPRFSPNGSRLAFGGYNQLTNVGGLYSINLDGTDEKQLTDSSNDGPPSWGTVATTAPTAATAPDVVGSGIEGEPYVTSVGSWLPRVALGLAFQWQRCAAAGVSCQDILGAGTDAYVPEAADVGSRLRALVTATDSAGSAPAASSITGVVAAAPPVNVGLPTITGSVVVGQIVSSTSGTWSGSPTGFTGQWRLCGSAGGGCTDIPGATGTTYAIPACVSGRSLRVAIVASGPGGTGPAASAARSIAGCSSGTPGPAPGPGPSGGGGGGGGTTTAPTPTPTPASTPIPLGPGPSSRPGLDPVLVASAIAQLLRESAQDKPVIADLLDVGGFTATFHAPGPGTVTIEWYATAGSSGRASASAARQVLVARGTRSMTGAVTAHVGVRLTKAGRRLLKNAAKAVKLVTRATFAPKAGPVASSTRTVTLRRGKRK